MCPDRRLSVSEGWRLQVQCSIACCNASPLTMYGPVQCCMQANLSQEAQCSGAVTVEILLCTTPQGRLAAATSSQYISLYQKYVCFAIWASLMCHIRDCWQCTGTFLRGALEKVGVDPNIKRIGKYKSAGDQLLRKDMSEAQREQLTAILDDLYEGFTQHRPPRGARQPKRCAQLYVRASPMTARSEAGLLRLHVQKSSRHLHGCPCEISLSSIDVCHRLLKGAADSKAHAELGDSLILDLCVMAQLPSCRWRPC